MESSNPVQRLLAKRNCIILDGALATLLESRGCDISSALWSCETLLSSPGLIRQVHFDYFSAGADVAITASYQASMLGLAKHRGMTESQARELIMTSVKLAQDAREQAAAETGRDKQDMLVAGSVGPYGAYLADGSEYRGEYGMVMSKDELKTFHRPRIAALLDAGADLLACETFPSVVEIEAVRELLETEFPMAWAWFSFTIADAEHLSDGTDLEDVCRILRACENIVAVGVNCIPRDETTAVLEELRTHTSVPLVAYPNSGESWDAERRQWIGSSNCKSEDASGPDNELTESARNWKTAGARLIGGCCRTGPDDVRRIKDALLATES